VQRIADSTGLGSRVRALPRPDDAELLRWLASADAAVFAVDPESPSAAGLVPREVFDCVHAGLPVVATQASDAGRLVRVHGLGAAAKERTPAAVAAALKAVFDSPGAGGEIAVQARRAARAELCWEKERLRLVDLYDEVGSGR
jgi:glycosyltransferase involved in cell wall biosynthesis